MWHRVCWRCGHSYESKRPWGHFCSRNCRQLYHYPSRKGARMILPSRQQRVGDAVAALREAEER